MRKIILAVVVMIMVGCNSKPIDEVEVTSYVNVEEREYTITLPVPTAEQGEVVVVVEPTPVPVVLPEVGITNVDFPFVSQLDFKATYLNDCGSATVLMVAKYYDLAGLETVDNNHYEMVGGDFPTNFVHLRDFIEEKYKLETKVVVTYEPLIAMLEEAKFDTSDIVLVSDIPHDVPVMWSYIAKAHWVVRFDGWVYDPLTSGGKPFEKDTTYRSWDGLGIIVYKGKDTPTAQPKQTIL